MTNKTITGLRCDKDNWFTCIDIEVLSDDYLLPSEKLIYAVLCMTAGFGYRTCSCSIEEVAEISGYSARTVRRAYRELEARGVIAREGEEIRLIGHNAPCYSEEES